MNVNLSAMMQTATTMLTAVGLKILGAIVIWVVGRWLINLALRLIGSYLTKQKIDFTLIRYIHSSVAGPLNVVLVIAILGFFGVETTSFAALIAAAGVAGCAGRWSGLLSNFAGGRYLRDSTAVQGWGLHYRCQRDRNGRGNRPVCYHRPYARQCQDHPRQREDLLTRSRIFRPTPIGVWT